LHGRSSRCITELYGSVYKCHLDASFRRPLGLTRRGVLEQLARGEASITDLAEKFQNDPHGHEEHVGVLEQAGLFITEKVGRVRTCKSARIDWRSDGMAREVPPALGTRFDELDRVIEDLKQREKSMAEEKK